MEIDQIELLTRSRNRDVRHILDNLPVKADNRSLRNVKDTISQEPEETLPPGEALWMQAALNGLSWATYSLAILATVFMTWAISSFFGK